MKGKHREVTARLHLRDGELGQPWPRGRGGRQAVRQPLRHLPAEVHSAREGSRDPRARRRGDPRRRRLRHRRRRMPAAGAGQRLDDHLRHLVGRLRGHAARRHARLHRAGRGGAPAMAGRADACLRAGRRRRPRRRGDRLSLGALRAAAAASSSSSRRAPTAGSRATPPASRRSPAAMPTRSWAASPAARSRR